MADHMMLGLLNRGEVADWLGPGVRRPDSSADLFWDAPDGTTLTELGQSPEGAQHLAELREHGADRGVFLLADLDHDATLRLRRLLGGDA
ncbi:hypothetical protein D5S17_35460 [Pseudonocardiaceae bacterium YIM PH 21723]|nr:hypothetical protein D5S17_35460 [Pseudonocardiaceae bacterium YIM PH 21723]